MSHSDGVARHSEGIDFEIEKHQLCPIDCVSFHQNNMSVIQRGFCEERTIQKEKITFDTNKCLTQRTGATDVFYCLSEKQNSVCGYSLYFGYRRVCRQTAIHTSASYITPNARVYTIRILPVNNSDLLIRSSYLHINKCEWS